VMEGHRALARHRHRARPLRRGGGGRLRLAGRPPGGARGARRGARDLKIVRLSSVHPLSHTKCG
jgi:hypothetical protein